jgi:hypothetical protein
VRVTPDGRTVIGLVADATGTITAIDIETGRTRHWTPGLRTGADLTAFGGSRLAVLDVGFDPEAQTIGANYEIVDLKEGWIGLVPPVDLYALPGIQTGSAPGAPPPSRTTRPAHGMRRRTAPSLDPRSRYS